MKAAFIEQTGPPEVITIGDLPEPKPSPTQCLVQVSAVDVNPIDVYVRVGMIPAKINFPFVIGRDLAGVVAKVGSQVRRFRVGDRVWASNLGFGGRQGASAEFAAVDEEWLYPIPGDILSHRMGESGQRPGEGYEVTDEQIVAMSLVGITAHLGLVQRAKLQAGEILFVNGGTGGVGSAVLQIGKILGAQVITTAGNDEKVSECKKLGADVAINYKTEDVDAEIKKFAANGVNVWWETLREPNFERTIPLLAMRGRMVVMAGRDAKPSFPVGQFYTKDCAIHGFAMFNSTAAEARAAAEDINRWMAEGKLKARIHRVLPLEKAAEAHRLQEESTVGKSGALAGKIVLKV